MASAAIGALFTALLLFLCHSKDAVGFQLRAPERVWLAHVDKFWAGNPSVLNNHQMRRRFDSAYRTVTQHNMEYAAGRQTYTLSYNFRSASKNDRPTGYIPSTLPPLAFTTIRTIKTSYASFNVSPAAEVNWVAKGRVGAVKDQKSCGACWAFASTSSIETAVAIASSTSPPNLSEQELIDCEKPDNVTNGGSCVGGDPLNAFNWIIRNKITDQAHYPSPVDISQNRVCNQAAVSAPVASMVRMEYVQGGSEDPLVAALNGQSVIVSVQANLDTFRLYTGGIYNDPKCDGSQIGHTMVAVGYGTAIVRGVKIPYWLLRNHWGTSWGERGYMRMQRVGGSGVCGVTYFPPLYPIVAPPPGSPCGNSPCGAGKCTPTGPSSYNCSWCPAGYVPTTDGSPTCALVDYCGAYSPCGPGTCSNDGHGGYTCSCDLAAGIKEGVNTNGMVTCVTGDVPGTYRTEEGDICFSIMQMFGLDLTTLLDINPSLDCGNLLPGTLLVVSPSISSNSVPPVYIVQPGDICYQIVQQFGITIGTLLRLNPGIDCSNLAAGTKLNISPAYGAGVCTSYHVVQPGDSCTSIAADANTTVAALLQLNQNFTWLNCQDIDKSLSRQLCVAGYQLGSGQKCVRYYVPRPKDKATHMFCKGVMDKFSLNAAAFKALNPSLFNQHICDRPLNPGSMICVGKCSREFIARRGSTYAWIMNNFKVSRLLLAKLNPSLSLGVSTPNLNQPICIATG